MAWAALDAQRKDLSSKLPALTVAFYLSAATIPLFFIWAYLAQELGFPEEFEYWIYSFSLGVLGATATVLFVMSVKLSPLSLTVPYLSLTPVISAVGGLFLGEFLTLLQSAGIVLVVLGGFLLHEPKEEHGQGILRYARALASDRGSVLMCLVAVCWGITPPLDKAAFAFAPVSLHAFLSNTFVGLLLFGLLFVRDKQLFFVVREAPLAMAAAGVVVSIALATQLLAISAIKVGVFEAIKRAGGVIFSLISGKVFFKEEITRRKLFACFLMACGVSFVTLAN